MPLVTLRRRVPHTLRPQLSITRHRQMQVLPNNSQPEPVAPIPPSLPPTTSSPHEFPGVCVHRLSVRQPPGRPLGRTATHSSQTLPLRPLMPAPPLHMTAVSQTTIREIQHDPITVHHIRPKPKAHPSYLPHTSHPCFSHTAAPGKPQALPTSPLKRPELSTRVRHERSDVPR